MSEARSELAHISTSRHKTPRRMAYKVRRPNVLFVMSDQHRHDWMGCAGLGAVETPNLDALASRGVRFTQATCNSPLCAPTRAALATGLRPPRCHVLDNAYSLDLEAWNVYQHLRRYGYRTALFGKLDLHKPQMYNGVHGDLPVVYQLGFTDPFEAEGKQHAAQEVYLHRDGERVRLSLGPYQHHLQAKGLLEAFSADYEWRYTQHEHYAEPSVLPLEDYEDHWIGQKACDYLRGLGDDSPWFTFVSFVGPHNPWDAPREYLEPYLDVPMPAPVPDPGADRAAWVQRQQEEMSRGTTAVTAQQMRQNYSAMVTLVDGWVGELLEIVQERGELENTLVVYASDHGEMLGDLGLVHKSLPYEPAVRVPLILAGWGVPSLPPSDALVELFDLTPTLLDLLSLPIPAGLDARSFLPLLRGETQDHRDVQIAQLPFVTCVRDRRFKAVSSPNDRPELYDLEVDPHEQRNLYDQQGQVYARLMQRLHEELSGGMALNA